MEPTRPGTRRRARRVCETGLAPAALTAYMRYEQPGDTAIVESVQTTGADITVNGGLPVCVIDPAGTVMGELHPNPKPSLTSTRYETGNPPVSRGGRHRNVAWFSSGPGVAVPSVAGRGVVQTAPSCALALPAVPLFARTMYV